MPEPHPGAQLKQPGLGRRRRGPIRDPQPAGRPPQQHRVSGGLGRRGQQQQPGRPGQALDPAQEILLDRARQRQRLGQPEAAGQLDR